MNNDTLRSILDRLESLEDWIHKSDSIIKSLKIDKQMVVNKDQRLKPGIACKIAYNSDGLVVDTDVLAQADIPDLNIEKILGLRRELDTKLGSSELDKVKKELSEVHHHSSTIATGCKVNVDAHGFVNNVCDLNPDDIPTLPIDKIEGLRSILSHLGSLETPVLNATNEYHVNPGTGCKIDYDEHGRVINKHDLDMDDIPSELISRINIMENAISTMATQKSLTNLSGIVVNKLDANNPIQSGIYTKIVVDSKGLVVSGDKLDKEDLPPIDIQDISGLRQELNSKADRSDFTTLNETVSSLVSSITRLGDIRIIKDQFESKADKGDMVALQNQVQQIKTLLDTIMASIPSDQILTHIRDMEAAINTIEGKITVLNSRLNIVI